MNTLTNHLTIGRHCLALPALLLLLSISAFGAELRGVVERVIDGDTFDLCSDRGEPYRIRLSGIDTPERGQPFYAQARESLSDLIEGKYVIVVWSKTDRYKRILGTVLLGSVNVNLEQMRGGFAWYFKRYASDVPEIERLQYEAAETEAREAKRGLWQQQQAIPPWEWRRRK